MSEGESDKDSEAEAPEEKSNGEAPPEEDEDLDKATEMAGLQKFKLRSEQCSEERRHTPSPEVRRQQRAGSQRSWSQRSPRKGKGKGHSRVLNRSRGRLGDGELVKLAKDCEENYDEIDLSRNHFTSEGVAQILEICKKSPDLKVLKLFNNQLGDEGAEELGEIFKHCHSIEEVHLSHNNFTEAAVEAMVKAANRELPRKAERPLWLRMEHNKVQNTENLAGDIEKHYPAVCAREDRARCTPRVCAMGKRIHLPFLIEAPKGKGRGRFPDRQNHDGKGHRRGRVRREDSRRRRPTPRRSPRRSRSRRRSSRRPSPDRRAPRLRSAPRRRSIPSPRPPPRRAPSPRWASESEGRSSESEEPQRIARELPAEETKLRPKARPRPKVRAVVPPMRQRMAAPKAMPDEEEYSYYSDYEYEYSYA